MAAPYCAHVVSMLLMMSYVRFMMSYYYHVVVVCNYIG
jgi:hypothetical protein